LFRPSLDEALRNADPSTKVYVLVGSQGAGKSTWARSVASTFLRPIVFDAILVKKTERQPILAAARARSVETIAVWFKTPLEVCIARNASRPPDEVVPVQAVRNVHSAIEPPSIAEGFSQVIEVASS
jgi:predicted kinase